MMGRPKGSKGKKEYTLSSKALAQRRGNVALRPAETEEEANYNARLIDHVLHIHEIASHADRSDVLTLKSCFISYMQLCQQDGFPVSNMAAYSAMGFTLQQFTAYAKRDDPSIREFVSFVKTTCAMCRESMVSGGKINPVIGIFWQRNYDGLRNDTEQVQAIQEQDEHDYTNQNYKEKYLDMIGE